ncbi:Violaxanthin de-epoxidase-domain-containing protein [Pavlovales sp. CCMP2436]|nr:Violaxanthin de-epoxidase-domain-containing protein [Pavlovales sp. CCMP2436]
MPRQPVRSALDGARGALAAAAFVVALGAGGAQAAEQMATTSGFADYSKEGGVMKADPSCFFEKCGTQTKDCFSNPSCLKGITCLGNCRAEQLCATRCFARFGSEKLNAWLSCTLEEQKCVTTGADVDNSAFYADAPPVLKTFKPSELEGRWFKVRGYNEKYDCYPCQINEFTATPAGLDNRILFRVPKADGSGFWQNDFVEHMRTDKGPQGKASMTVEGKMFGLTFGEQWYVLGESDGTKNVPEFRLVAYKGDTQQGPYEGAFVYTKEFDSIEKSPALMAAIDSAAKAAGLDSAKFCVIDNACPAAGGTIAGAGSEEGAKDKLEWKDLFELAEWFRPGTLAKPTDFDPNKM